MASFAVNLVIWCEPEQLLDNTNRRSTVSNQATVLSVVLWQGKRPEQEVKATGRFCMLCDRPEDLKVRW
jgi:hypothetical protein